MLVRTIRWIFTTARKVTAATLNALLFNTDLAGGALCVVTAINTATFSAILSHATIGMHAARGQTSIFGSGVLKARV